MTDPSDDDEMDKENKWTNEQQSQQETAKYIKYQWHPEFTLMCTCNNLLKTEGKLEKS